MLQKTNMTHLLLMLSVLYPQYQLSDWRAQLVVLSPMLRAVDGMAAAPPTAAVAASEGSTSLRRG